MSAVKDAVAALNTALKGVEQVRLHADPGAAINPPATVVGPPSLTWDALAVWPTAARFLVYVVVAADQRALERLWDLVPVVAEAIDGLEDAVVVRADPGTYQTSGGELPCYQIQVDYAL